MVSGQNLGVADAVGAAMAWWRDAGLDHDYADEPQNWLARPVKVDEPVESPASAPPAERRARAVPSQEPATETVLDRSAWPNSLDGFIQWWLGEPALDGGRVERRVAPRGPGDTAVMVILPEPEPEDSETLLSGPNGRFVAQMLSAFGFAADSAYLATVLPRQMAMPDWQALQRQGFGDLLAHHIGLVRPQRVIALGSNILPLLGHAPANSPALLTKIDQGSLQMPVLATRDLSLMRDRPRWKAAVWSAWLDWEI